jgi:hypothetical protein
MEEMAHRRIEIISVSITVTISADDRAVAVAEFTSPDTDCQALTTTYNCGGTDGINYRNWRLWPGFLDLRRHTSSKTFTRSEERNDQ